MNLSKAESYFKARGSELIQLSKQGTVWEFLCMCSMIEYLSKMTAGKDNKQQGYKDFVQTWLIKVSSAYSTFRFNSGTQDLPDQMYHVLRCGLIHSFSLIPDNTTKSSKGRDRSIVICHRPEALSKQYTHLMNYSKNGINDAALFISEDFSQHILEVIDQIFVEAKSNSQLKNNIEKWLNTSPPIAGGF